MLALLLPSALKFSHIFNHHQHEICNGEYQAHLHKTDIECNFYKFKLSSSFTLSNIEFEFISVTDNHHIDNLAYSFLSDFQQLHFTLRGPPQINLV